MDGDGTWGLEAVQNIKSSQTTANVLSADFGQRDDLEYTEIFTFEGLLHAMYREAYEVYSASELKNLVRLADFYCALPVVSSSLDGVLLSNPMFIENMSRGCMFPGSRFLHA